jgi:hypothetical protein
VATERPVHLLDVADEVGIAVLDALEAGRFCPKAFERIIIDAEAKALVRPR